MKHLTKRIYLISMVLQGLLWILFITGVLGLPATTGMLIRVLMLINGLFFIALAFIGHRARWLSVLTVAFLVINLVLTVTDQMGVYDYTVLIMNIISIVCFITILQTAKSKTSRQAG